MSDLLVVDEWLWHDLGGENEEAFPGSQRRAAEFLQKVFEKCDRIVLVEGSSFAVKALRFFKNAAEGRHRREIAKFYKSKFFFNSDKSFRLDPGQLCRLPPDIATQTKEEDHYLVQAYFASGAKTIITSDGPLREALSRNNIPCEDRNDFLDRYKP